MSIQAKSVVRVGLLSVLMAAVSVGCTPDQINAATQIMSTTVTPMMQGQGQQTTTQQTPSYVQRGQLTLNKQSFARGEQIQVTYRAPAGLDRNYSI